MTAFFSIEAKATILKNADGGYPDALENLSSFRLSSEEMVQLIRFRLPFSVTGGLPDSVTEFSRVTENTRSNSAQIRRPISLASFTTSIVVVFLRGVKGVLPIAR